MIYIALNFNSIYDEVLNVRERVKCESADGYRLLCDLYKKIYGREMPEITKDGRGKPYFSKEGEPSFNISHTKGASLAAIDTEGKALGADIQIEIPQDKAKRVLSRFPRTEYVSDGGQIKELLFLVFDEASGTFKPFTPDIYKRLPTSSDFSAKWALTEAILKAEGGGFGSYCNLDSINGFRSASFKIKGVKTYFISVVSLN